MFKKISLASIDLEDVRFLISEDLDPPQLEESLRQVGQLNPLLLQDTLEGGYRVVAGFRRLRAMRRLAYQAAWARILDRDMDALAVFRAALWDNLAHRRLTPFECARVVDTLKNGLQLPASELIAAYLPSLGLGAHKDVLRKFLALHRLDPTLRKNYRKGLITWPTVERLSVLPQSRQQKLALFLDRVYWSASVQRECLMLIEELAVIFEVAPEEVVRRPEVSAILEKPELSARQKGEQVRDVLFRLRNPRLSNAKSRFLRQRKQLSLPGKVKVTPDPFFESNRLHVQFDASCAEEFREIADALRKASGESNLAGLFHVE